MELDADDIVLSCIPGVNVGASELIKVRSLLGDLNAQGQKWRDVRRAQLVSYKSRLRARYRGHVTRQVGKHTQQALLLFDLLEQRARNKVACFLELALREILEQCSESLYESVVNRVFTQRSLLGDNLVLEVRCAPPLCRLIALKNSDIKVVVDEELGRYEIMLVTSTGTCSFNLEENIESFLHYCRALVKNGDLSE